MLPKPACNVYLIGFMGSGKSSVGRQLARRLDRRFIDTDDCIEQEAGKSITEIFRDEGEEGFRQREKRCITEVVTAMDMVVALGGGAIVLADNWRKIRGSGVTFYLDCPVELLVRRLEGETNRPLLQANENADKLERITLLLSRRQKYYRRADFTISVTENTSIDEVVTLIVKRLQELE